VITESLCLHALRQFQAFPICATRQRVMVHWNASFS
jgi:hypothetical protein